MPDGLEFSYLHHGLIAAVVTRTISHESNETPARPECAIGSQFVNNIAYILNHFDILPFAVSADVVSFSDAAPFEDGADGRAMVFHKKPVAHIATVTIDGQRLTFQRIENH